MIDILVIGSGPTGLTAAAEALRHGLTARIIDRKEKRVDSESRALVVHSRTLEVLDYRVSDELLKIGEKSTSIHLRVGKKHDLHKIEFSGFPWGDTEFPFFLVLPQYDTEKVLQKEVERLGGRIEWGVSLSALTQKENIVESTVMLLDGSEEIIQSRWVVGCDGGRSKTREEVGIELKRENTDKAMILFDFKTKTNDFSSALNVTLHPEGTSLIISINPGENLWRGIGMFPKGVEKDAVIDKSFIDDFISLRLGVNVDAYDIGWTAAFNVSYGVTNKYREGCVFLAGDACHVHSPAGGQGMNFGIQDSCNLIWKLAWAKRMEQNSGEKTDSIEKILSSYEAERMPLASTMVKSTRLATNVNLSHNYFLYMLRETFAPSLLKSNMAAKMLSQNVSMLSTQYALDSPIILPLVSSSNTCELPWWKHHLPCDPGQRLPNFLTSNGKLIHREVDRKRHSWVIVHSDKDLVQAIGNLSQVPGNLRVVHAVLDNKTKRKAQTYTVLVRPDLFVAAVDILPMEEIWENLKKILGEDTLLNM